MTSRLRGSAKEEPKPTSLLSSKSRTYLGSSRQGESRDKSNNFEGSRNKVSRKDSRGKYESFAERSDAKYNTNGYRSPPPRDFDQEELDPDLLYRRSRDHFGTWNIQDIISGKDQTSTSPVDDKGSKSQRKSRFDMFKSNGVDAKKIANGNVRTSKHKSPEMEEKRFASGERKHKKNRSPDFEDHERITWSKKNSYDKSRTKSPVKKEIDRTNLAYNDEENYPPKKNRALLEEIENFASNRRGLSKTNESPERTDRRYADNVSPERENEKIRILIDRFKSNDQNNDTRESAVGKFASSQRHRSPSNENDKYRIKMRNSVDGFSSVDRRYSKEKSDDWQNGERHRSLDRRNTQCRNNETDEFEKRRKWNENQTNGDSTEGGSFRKRTDTYNVERVSREKDDDNAKELSSKRRSYVYSGSPEHFDVHIQKYERALTGPRKDPELSRKTDVKRRSSLKIKEELNEAQERNGRHNRPLTPPALDDTGHEFQHRNKTFNTKDWYETNKQFAAKYLQENSKVRLTNEEEGNYDIEDAEFCKDHVRHVSPIREQQKATYFGAGGDDDRRRNLTDDQTFRHKHTSSFRTEIVPREAKEPNNAELKANRKFTRNYIEDDKIGGKRNEPITIKIRNVLGDDSAENERPRTKRTVFTNDEPQNGRIRKRYDNDSPKRDARGTRDKEDWTSATTPARKIWSYRDGGAQITDVDKGQPCLKCGETCSGFLQHPWRKNCQSCKCPRETHDVRHEEWVSVRSRLGLKGDGASGSVACDPREMGLTWAPPGLPSHKVEEYFSMLPEISVPRIGTPGERYRDRQLAMQLPKQDLAKAYCRHLASEHYTSADDFMAARNEIALDIGTVQEVLEAGAKCAGCRESLKYGSLVVSAGKLGELYHPACFQCVQCNELLVDLAYCVYNDAVYCERHYAERLKGRCAACDELIFSGEFTKAMNKDWHSGHFCCWQCDESLTGQRYVLRDEHPYCIKCYESVFANGCEECSKIIGIDSKDLSYKDKHWHEACFLCNKCRVSLVDKQFGSKVDKIYCGNCYDAQFASRCDGCGEIFRAGTKKMEYKTRQWHEKCFCCVVCKNAIGTKSFIPREQEIYCAGCYEDKFATRCVKCNKIITSGGVTYKNEPWHRECFTCSNCSTSLAGQRFTSRDEKPYCADCFGELFAKRCTACTKPITGIGGTRFISFEDRHWHNDCFICAGCKTSLVGRGFITDADDIICPECAKQKLM